MPAAPPPAPASADSPRRLTPEDLQPRNAPATPPSKVRLFLIIIFFTLLVIAGGVIFLLPQWVADSSPPAIPASDEGDTAVAEKAQVLLQQVLSQWMQLKSLEVSSWPDVQVENVEPDLAKAESLVNRESYEQAIWLLQKLNLQLDELLQDQPRYLENVLSNGQRDLAARAADGAERWFRLALKMDAENDTALQGIKQAEQIRQVDLAMLAGKKSEEEEKLPDALDHYQKALTVDPNFLPAKDAYDRLKSRLDENSFKHYMSVAYRALDEGKWSAAHEAFSKAAAIRPNDRAVKDGLRQITEVRRNAKLVKLKQQADDAVDALNWQQAIKNYDEALKVDSKVAFAVQGKQLAQEQLQITKQLTTILANRDRLYDESARHNATQWVKLASTKGIGEGIQSQVQQINSLLKSAAQKVSLTLLSDDETDISIYRVGKLGTFENKHLSLPAGKYLVRGTRTGYRDVQVSLELTGAEKTMEVTVKCEEQI